MLRFKKGLYCILLLLVIKILYSIQGSKWMEIVLM